MFPLGHAAFGYLLYSLFAWLTRHRLPYGLTLVALLVGTQFPDIVDKPLAFLGVLPSGRALGHSLFFAAGLFVLLWQLSRRYDVSHLTVAFGFGHAAHIVSDVVGVDIFDPEEVRELAYLVWPVLPAPEYSSDSIAPWVRIVQYYRSPELSVEFVLLPLTLVVFVLIEQRRRRMTPR